MTEAGPPVPSVSFVGREFEIGLLRRMLDEAIHGSGSVVLLAGEPGIGKTRLAEQLASEAHNLDAQVLWGRCYEGEGAPSFWPWVQVIRDYVRERDAECLREQMGPGAADIAQVVPEVRQRLPELAPPTLLEPAQARFRFFDSVARFLAAATRTQPIVLVLDDLHWADDSSLLLLQFLAREIRTVPALVIGTYRDNEIDSEHPLTATLSELARAEHSERLVLAGLAHVEIARFIELSDDRPFPSGIVETIARETEGNPFFVTQIVRLLHAEGWPQLTDTPDTWNLAVPQSVRAVIGRRLKRLSPECNRTLTAAAVIGRVFGLAVLSRVRELPGDDVLEYLSEAEAAQVITRVPSTLGQFTFIHALVRETLYEGLGSADRARLHRKTGVALEGLYGSRSDAHISELAHHFAQGAPSGAVAKGAAYAVRAAERATRMLAYEEAVRHYQTALRVLALEERDDASRRLDLLLALGEAQNRIGAWDLAREAFREAAELANSIDRPEQFARAALGSGAVGSIPGVADKQLVHQLETALALVGASDSRLRVGLLGRLAMELIYTDEGARRNNLSRDAIEMARRLNEPIALAQALDSMHVAMKGPENLDERLVIASEIVQLAENAGANELALQGRTWRLSDLVELGDMPAVDAEAEALFRFANESRQPVFLYHMTSHRALRANLEGRFGEGESLAQEARSMALRMQFDFAEPSFTLQMFPVRQAQGRLDELETAVRTFSERYRSIPGWSCHLAALLVGLGRKREARKEFNDLMANHLTDLPRDANWLLCIALLSQVCAELADASRAPILYRSLVPYERRCVTTGRSYFHGCSSRSLGLLAAQLGRWSDAERHFRLAAEIEERMGARPWLARTHLDYGTMLVRSGKRQRLYEAEVLVQQAIDTAQELGMNRLIEQALALKEPLGALRTAGMSDASRYGKSGTKTGNVGTPQDALPTHPNGLTNREVEVLRLLASGRLNREIAGDLALSLRTVEHHIAHIYSKIGARGRADATSYTIRHELL